MADDTKYISPEGLEKLKEELQERKTVTRKEIAEKIGQAKELGDLSENFEYHDAKEIQAQNESRIIELENLIRNLVVADKQVGATCIAVGTSFTVDVNGEEKKFQLVGGTESDPMSGKISNESPLGGKFIDKCVGDSVEMETPAGTTVYKVTNIE